MATTADDLVWLTFSGACDRVAVDGRSLEDAARWLLERLVPGGPIRWRCETASPSDDLPLQEFWAGDVAIDLNANSAVREVVFSLPGFVTRSNDVVITGIGLARDDVEAQLALERGDGAPEPKKSGGVYRWLDWAAINLTPRNAGETDAEYARRLKPHVGDRWSEKTLRNALSARHRST